MIVYMCVRECVGVCNDLEGQFAPRWNCQQQTSAVFTFRQLHFYVTIFFLVKHFPLSFGDVTVTDERELHRKELNWQTCG